MSFEDLESRDDFMTKTVSLSKSIKFSNSYGIVSEFKRRSPSKININIDAKINDIIPGYINSGVSGISILTDNKFFGGSINDLRKAKRLSNLPILRKDFIIDEFQILESKSIGTDAILLIAACLKPNDIYLLSKFAKSLGLEVLLEIHSLNELNNCQFDFIDIIGVNNRNLKDFATDIKISIRLFDHLPSELIKISESGILNKNHVLQLYNVGYDGFLIGENFMNSNDPGKSCESFIKKLNDS